MEPELYEVTLRSKKPSKTAVRSWLTSHSCDGTAQVALKNNVETKSESAYSLLRQRRLCERCVNPSRLWLRHTCRPKEKSSLSPEKSGVMTSRARECRLKDSSSTAPSRAVQEAPVLQKCSAFCVRRLTSKKKGTAPKPTLSNTVSPLKSNQELLKEEQRTARTPDCADSSPRTIREPAYQQQTGQRRPQSVAGCRRPRHELADKRRFLHVSPKSVSTSRPPHHKIADAKDAFQNSTAAALSHIKVSNLENEEAADITSFYNLLNTTGKQHRTANVIVAGRDACVREVSFQGTRNIMSRLPERPDGIYPYIEKEGNVFHYEEKFVPAETLMSPECGEKSKAVWLYNVFPFKAPHVRKHSLYSYGERRSKSVPSIHATTPNLRKCNSSPFSKNTGDLTAEPSAPHRYNAFSEFHEVYTEQQKKRAQSRNSTSVPNFIWRPYGASKDESAIGINDGAARTSTLSIMVPAGLTNEAELYVATDPSRMFCETKLTGPFDQNNVSVILRRLCDEERREIVCSDENHLIYKREQGEGYVRDLRGEPQLSILRVLSTVEKRMHSGATIEDLTQVTGSSCKPGNPNSSQLLNSAFDSIVFQQYGYMCATNLKDSSDNCKGPGKGYLVEDFKACIERDYETQKKKEQDSALRVAGNSKREGSAHVLSVDQCGPSVRLICERVIGIFSSIERFLHEKDPDRKREELDQIYSDLVCSHRTESEVTSAVLLV